ncbi:MAG: hypothetical protein M3Z18_02985 [Gemmatimonadota bacterium]|nr:hypothetical protein [Gemmatimonadota bacterium]
MRDFGPEIAFGNESGQNGGFTLKVPKGSRATGASRALIEVLVDGLANPRIQSLVEVVV